MKRAVTMIGLAALAGLSLGCSSTETAGCKSDADCDPGFVCVSGTGVCECGSNDACGEGRYCNPYGACQDRPPCLGNDDCADSEICNSADPSGGKCIPNDECGSSVHCELNQYCNPSTRRCTAGCRNTGDCELGLVCVAGSCVDNGASCDTCPASPSPDAAYCDYGEICTSDGRCQAHANTASLCKTCGELGQSCGAGTVCLIDDDTADSSYCSPGCRIDSDCPNGFGGCGGLSLVSSDKRCSNDNDCDAGIACLVDAEGDQGFCGCATQNDCDFLCAPGLFGGAKVCMTDFSTPCEHDADCTGRCANNKCTGTDLPCGSDADCDIVCNVTSEGERTVGMCETVAKACGKVSGLSCQTVLSGTAACRGL